MGIYFQKNGLLIFTSKKWRFTEKKLQRGRRRDKRTGCYSFNRRRWGEKGEEFVREVFSSFILTFEFYPTDLEPEFLGVNSKIKRILLKVTIFLVEFYSSPVASLYIYIYQELKSILQFEHSLSNNLYINLQ